MEIFPIAYIETPFTEKFGIPRQASAIPHVKGRIVFVEKFRNLQSVRAIETFDYIWLIWGFSQVDQDHISPTVRPPRLGGNKRVGVFASRSPFRPNRLGLSSVRLVGIDKDCQDGPALWVSGVDMVSGTPIYDIKPYSEEADSHTNIRSGFIDEVTFDRVEVELSEDVAAVLNQEERQELIEILQADPRPAYQRDQDRIYGMKYKNFNVRFQGSRRQIRVLSISE